MAKSKYTMNELIALFNDGYIPTDAATKDGLTALGFAILSEADGLSKVVYPDGWTCKEICNPVDDNTFRYWELLDTTGVPRVGFSVSTREAFITGAEYAGTYTSIKFHPRLNVWDWPEIDGVLAAWGVPIEDPTSITSFRIVLTDIKTGQHILLGESRAAASRADYESHNESFRGLVETKYPDYNNPLAYWDDVEFDEDAGIIGKKVSLDDNSVD